MGRSRRPGFGQEPTLGEPPERRYQQHLIAVLHLEYPIVFGVHAPTGADRGANMQKLLSFCLLVLLATSARAADSAVESVAVASRAWDEAYASGDATRLAERYDAQAVSMPPGLPALASRSVIEADFKAFFESNTATHRTFDADRQIAGDFVIERARYEATIRPKDGSAAVHEAGKHVVVYRRQADSSWKVFWEIWNSDD